GTDGLLWSFLLSRNRSVIMILFHRRSRCLPGCILGLLLAATFAGTALAQSVTDDQSALAYFNRLDQQKKGSFALADMQRIEGKEFKRTDANQDGKLSLDEYVYGIPADRTDELRRYTKRFHLSDKNQDGYISYDE